jgi:hypothetical protein
MMQRSQKGRRLPGPIGAIDWFTGDRDGRPNRSDRECLVERWEYRNEEIRIRSTTPGHVTVDRPQMQGAKDLRRTAWLNWAPCLARYRCTKHASGA